MAAVDLRSNYERTYSQGSDNACGPYAVCAALDCLFERATGKPHRFDPMHIWHHSKAFLGLSGNVGSTHDSLADALENHGAKLGDDVLTGFKFVRTHPEIEHIKDLLTMGVPIVWLMKVTPQLQNQNNGKPWQKHEWGTFDLSQQYGMHYVCIAGFDDEAQRWLVENSWGADWGDGGFFGVPYADFFKLSEGFSHIDSAPVLPKGEPVMVTNLRWSEAVDFVDRSKTGMAKMLAEKMESGGAEAVVKTAVEWGISDKHVELCFGWPRGTVREFARANPSVNFEGFVWDQL